MTLPAQGLAADADADGRFAIDEVTTAGRLTLTARRGGPSGLLFGALTGIVPVPGGVTDAGVLALVALDRTDTDADGVPDVIEALLGTDPALPDSDGDGITDGREDRDGDLSPDALEILLGTDPARPDSDGDGVLDGLEDGDGDELSDVAEVGLGTDPFAVDTDGDGFGDGAEVGAGSDPLNPARVPIRAAYATISVRNAASPSEAAGVFIGAPVSILNSAAPEAIGGATAGPAVSVENLAPVQ